MEAYSYTDFIKRNNILNENTDIKIKTSIDLIKLTNVNISISDIDSEIKGKYKISSDRFTNSKKFFRNRIYENDDKAQISILYENSSHFASKVIHSVTIHEPNDKIIEDVHFICNKLSQRPNINKIELAWDFYTDDTYNLQKYLEKYIYLKYKRNPSCKYKNTFYTNDLRNSCKGVRIYPKPINAAAKKFVRLELEIHRSKIRQLGLTFPLTAQQLQIDFSKFFVFKYIDTETLINFLKKHYAKINSRKNGRKYQFNKLDNLLDIIETQPIMTAIEHIQSGEYFVPSYHRFLIPMEKENSIIQKAAQEQKFSL